MLFSFELCVYNTHLYVALFEVLLGLLFSFELCLPTLVALDLIKYFLKREDLEGFGKEIAEKLGLAKRIAFASAGSPFRVTVVPAEETGGATETAAAEAGGELPI